MEMRKGPRRVRSAYVFFVMDHYRPLVKHMKTQSPRRIIRALAFQWRHATGVREREVYEQKERRDRERYREEKATWVHPIEKERPELRRRRLDPARPIRTRNAFIFFEKHAWPEIRAENQNKSQLEMIRELSRKWRELPEDEKMVYREMATEDKKRYAAEIREYKQKIHYETEMRKMKFLEARKRCMERRRAQLAAALAAKQAPQAPQPGQQVQEPQQGRVPAQLQQPNQPVQPQQAKIPAQPQQRNVEPPRQPPPPPEPPQPQ